MKFTLYVDLKGSRMRGFDDEEEHLEMLVSQTSGLVRGMGLANRTVQQEQEDKWPGGCDQFGVGHGMTRLASTWEHEGAARRMALTLANFLLANAWQDHLLAVFVTSSKTGEVSFTAHGKARSYIELVCYAEDNR